MLEIKENEKMLLEISAKDLSKELNENKDALQIRMKAFDHLLDNNEEVQVHVLVTRNSDDFLEDFQMEVMNRL
jgi:hypothetical protein